MFATHPWAQNEQGLEPSGSGSSIRGTWYWNRYPGLMCDTESYIYVALLEETGYMSRNKYASGSEIQADGTGWQRRRQMNFNAFTCNEEPLPSLNKVDDGWTRMPSFSVLIGGPQSLQPDYIERIKTVDMVRHAKIREGAHDIVQSAVSADLLTPWYPGWCKRPCFHDDYLSAFNLPNVELVEIRHQGISHCTAKGLVVNHVEYELDAIILSTG
ncbi:hypothetical protein BDW59DRAFT_161057 [Aspergillus cavernicola]|uniref:FAD/NAD(P)-binding domain-containing protein n=1 Tax=Aspergillus cavernicola TaxID=176166 RepID=A0ABR4IEQ6_9EURO